ncbi:MAG: threonylcarbamoyl-AMP synthase [Myxococcaceae bacterium]|nr:threonylcarbamoyl-AMP synthase [Myxococcaceae bacterium]
MDSTENLRARIELAARALLTGGVVVYPTETFYGLGASLGVAAGVERLVAIKGREAMKPLPVIAADEASARALWREFPLLAGRLAARFWPGPLTIVLPAREGVPRCVAPLGEVGVRVSPHPVALSLTRLVGPLVATSANLAGGGEKTCVAAIDPAVVARVDAVIDAGSTPGGLPSTVLRVRGDRVQILREGAISPEAIAAVVGEWGGAIDG